VSDGDGRVEWIGAGEEAWRLRVRQLEDERERREQFVDSFAHDLRGPLTVALAAVDLLLKRSPSEERQHLLRRAHGAILRADRMLRDLLDAARVRAGQPLPLTLAECDLSVLIMQLVDELALSAGERRFLLRVDPGVRGVWCERELRRAVWNLVTNALKYGPQTAPIGIEVTWLDGGSAAQLLVHNDGAPIADDVLQGLFHPFQREAGARGGWGLGLALVRACVDAHGGRVAVRSADGQGTTFTVELPRDSRPHYEALTQSVAAPAP
jgi:signal transduction histidine kinase